MKTLKNNFALLLSILLSIYGASNMNLNNNSSFIFVMVLGLLCTGFFLSLKFYNN